MGLLRDTTFWSGVTKTMHELRPVQGRIMSREDTVRFLDTACKALTDLSEDHELGSDLELAAKILDQNGRDFPPLYTDGLQSFVSEFSRAEAALLLQSGMDFDCAVDLVNELRAAAQYMRPLTPDAVYGIRNALSALRYRTCNAAHSEHRQVEQYYRLRTFWRGVKGWAAVGFDTAAGAGAMVTWPTIAGPILVGTVAAFSIGIGGAMVIESQRTMEDRDL